MNGGALLLDLNRNRLGTAMAEALADNAICRRFGPSRSRRWLGGVKFERPPRGKAQNFFAALITLIRHTLTLPKSKTLWRQHLGQTCTLDQQTLRPLTLVNSDKSQTFAPQRG